MLYFAYVNYIFFRTSDEHSEWNLRLSNKFILNVVHRRFFRYFSQRIHAAWKAIKLLRENVIFM